ncbi:MAG: GFA family protein [Kofleriaceae bacterium]|nr:GFA family protein [Kofleriaceae bacterium]
MFVHCCHCRWCQRETGSAFVINAILEADRVELLAGTPEVIDTPSNSGRGQKIARCPTCKVAVWSTYSMPMFRFVRVGTLDDPDIAPPDVHIFTMSKQQWFELPPSSLAFVEYYDSSKVWPAESLERRAAALAKAPST